MPAPTRLAQLAETPGGAQLVLRAFLGVTFTYAGLQKLTNRFFFNAANPGSIQAQLHSSIATSPIGPVLRLAADFPVVVGLLIAFGELAVGLGTLVGLFGRVAAAGGMALSLTLFLSVSFNTTPYFLGSDIVFFFAWTPLVIAGSGRWSADAVLADRLAADRAQAKKAAGQPAPELDRRAAVRRVASGVAPATFAVVTAGIAATIGRMSPTPSGQTGPSKERARTAAPRRAPRSGRRATCRSAVRGSSRTPSRASRLTSSGPRRTSSSDSAPCAPMPAARWRSSSRRCSSAALATAPSTRRSRARSSGVRP